MADRPMPERSSLQAMYPSNSSIKDPEIKGTIDRKKTSAVKKIEHEFFKSTVKDSADYVVKKVLLPAAVKTLNDMLHKFIDALMNNGSAPSSAPSYSGSSPYVSYRSYYDDRRSLPPEPSYRGGYDLGDIRFEFEEDAQRMLHWLQRNIESNGSVTVGLFLDKCRLKTSETDFNWGWYSMDDASYYKRNNGWYIDFPPAKRIRG